MRRRRSARPVGFLAIVWLLALEAGADLDRATRADGDALPAPVTAAMQSVVTVRVREVRNQPVWRNGRFQAREVAEAGAGSGVVLSEDGTILTSAHLVSGASSVRIRLASGREEEARVTAIDDASDLALLRAPGNGYRPIAIAPGPLPPPGTAVFVAGNRGDRGTELRRGRLGLHRCVRIGARPIEFWAQVDTAIGPGDSGGAVLNVDGELLGVPGLQVIDPGVPPATAAGSRTADGAATLAADGALPVGLFIPAAHARRAARRMAEDPGSAWPFIGLLLDDPLLAQAGGRGFYPESGALVRRVLPGSPAEAAGFLRGDRLVSIGGRPVRNIFEALDAVLDLKVGDPAPIEIDRDGQRLSLTARALARPPDPRPDPIDDFALHTGLRLAASRPPRGGRGSLAFASYSGAANDLLGPEAEWFRGEPSLAAILPGADLLRGSTRKARIDSPEDLAALIERCFVERQFVAIVHWEMGGGRAIDRVHVHRKIYPVVI